MKGSVVYFVRCLRFVKIGYSGGGLKGAIERLESFRTGNPFPVSLLWVVLSGVHTEGYLHQHFAQHAVAGEWFRLRGDLLTFIRRGMAAKSVYLDWRQEGPCWVTNENRETRRRNAHNPEYVQLAKQEQWLKHRLTRLQLRRRDIAANDTGWAPAHGESKAPSRAAGARFDREGRNYFGEQARARRDRVLEPSTKDMERESETMKSLMGPVDWSRVPRAGDGSP